MPRACVGHVRLPASVEYTVTPIARGDSSLGPAVVRVDGPWRLGWRQTTVGEPRSVRVDPNLAAIDVYEALARRGQLAEIGLRTMRLRTEGSEFERVREAFPDDPQRSINWRATARTGRLMATELIPERAQPLVICLDHGRLMGIGAGELTKLDHAINAALLLVHVALRSGDRAGMLAFADTVTSTLPPRAGTAQLRRFLDATRPIVPGETEADYDDALNYLQPVADAPIAGGDLHGRARPRPGESADPAMRAPAPTPSAARRDRARSGARRRRECGAALRRRDATRVRLLAG